MGVDPKQNLPIAKRKPCLPVLIALSRCAAACCGQPTGGSTPSLMPIGYTPRTVTAQRLNTLTVQRGRPPSHRPKEGHTAAWQRCLCGGIIPVRSQPSPYARHVRRIGGVVHMLGSADRDAIVSAARRHQAKRVLIFGSALSGSGPARDIDMGVEGVPPSRFFDFYADVMFSVSKPVDIVDLRTLWMRGAGMLALRLKRLELSRTDAVQTKPELRFSSQRDPAYRGSPPPPHPAVAGSQANG